MYQTSTDLHSIIVLQFDPMKVKKKNRTEQEERKQEAQIGSNCRTITEFKSVLASCFLSSCSVLVFFFYFHLCAFTVFGYAYLHQLSYVSKMTLNHSLFLSQSFVKRMVKFIGLRFIC